MTKATQFRVFLALRNVRKRGADIQGRAFVRAEWISRPHGVVMYQSKVCAALNHDDARAQATQLAYAWLAKQNEPPKRSQNVIAAEEWSGPRYVDTTGSFR